jgi:hypothetical protein
MRISRVLTITILAAVCASAVYAAGAPQAESVIRTAARQGRYVFITFYQKSDPASTKMLADVKKLGGKLSKKAVFTTANVGDSAHKGLMKRYGIDTSPVPITIVLAPNGAATAEFPREITVTDFSSVFVSRGQADVLKALQDQKMAVICLQNSKTKHNAQSYAAAKGLEKNIQFEGLVRVIKIDPSSRAESGFLKSLKLSTSPKEAQIAVVASVGKVLGKFSGAVTTGMVVDGLNEALGGGSSNCGPSGGCAPGG